MKHRYVWADTTILRGASIWGDIHLKEARRSIFMA